MVERFERALEAFTVGDALGMPTEFMTHQAIKSKFGLVDKLLAPSLSQVHTNLKKGQITDDTEQNLYLIDTYYRDGKVTVKNTVEGLIRWIEETGADKMGYVGPSSLKALKRIRNGEDPKETGISGTTCGAAMRAMAPSLSVKNGDVEALKKAVWSCSIPTHNTNIALEAAMALGFAIHKAASGESFDGIIRSSIEGAAVGRELADGRFVGASTGERIKYFLREMNLLKSTEQALSFLYNVIGTTMASNEVVPASFAVFAYAREDAWLSVKIGASAGGDTDTIAAIAGLLSSLYAGAHNIPAGIVSKVLKTNALNLKKYAAMISEMFGK